MVQTNFEIFLEHVGQPKRAWQGHAPFSLQNYCTRMVENSSIIPFKLSRQWSKIILEILSSMSDSPKWRGRATTLFRYKIIAREWLNVFA